MSGGLIASETSILIGWLTNNNSDNQSPEAVVGWWTTGALWVNLGKIKLLNVVNFQNRFDSWFQSSQHKVVM